jgi:glycosyltransferase involved in cell wall biosynthesis
MTATESELRASEQPTICHVLHNLNGGGGTQALATKLTRALSHRYRFTFACLDSLGTFGLQLREEGYAVTLLHRRPGIDFGCARRLANFLGREKVRIVHAHHYSPFFYATAARGLGASPPVLYAEHGPFGARRSRRSRVLYNRLAVRKVDRLVAVGETMREAMASNDGFPADQVEVIYNGVDASVFASDRLHRAAVRRALGLAPAEFVVIHVARLDPVKDHLTAIKAMQRVARQRPNVRLLLVGEGSEQERIETEIASRGLAPSVRLLGMRDDVANLLQAADLFLLTSINETISVAAIEAMCAGLPVVATRVGGMPEVVIDGETGLLRSSGDCESLAAAILHLMEYPALAFEMGRRGRRRAEELFSERQMSFRYQNCYQEMLRHDGHA